ncbi:MAG TPA: EAL domain-containing protein [Acidimicrobiales bacterium]|nr:EAL domain-containing protein [Acidimicrobiales bacterium]
MNQEAFGSDHPERTWSLRREWSRAFTVMLVLLLLAASASIVGVWRLVDGVRGTASRLDRESVASSALSTNVVAHEEVAHKILSDETVDRSAFLRQQQAISTQFEAAERLFPTTNGMRASVIAAHRSWQKGLSTFGLWGPAVLALHGNHAADNLIYGASSDASDGLLTGLEAPSLAAMNNGLSRGVDLERILISVLAGLFVLASTMTVYFRRRMVKDLVRPVATMHQGVARLQAGDYDHRIAVARRDELGELATAFNDMAGALHESHRALTRRASHDSLTGLPNRDSLTQRLAASFSSGSDRRASHEGVLFVDIDDFKDVNDSLGHDQGDALLVQLSARLNDCVRPQDLVARLGGDEFAVVVIEDEGETTAVGVAERILDSLRQPFLVNGARLLVSVSIGVAQRNPGTLDAAELLRHADFAMYMAKGAGKSRYQLFDAKMHDNMLDRSALKADLARAVPSGQLRLEYQPIIDLFTRDILGVEALVRWRHPTLGLLFPVDFITLAEETGDIDAIGNWVLEAATRQVGFWRRTVDHCGRLWVAVNLSPIQLKSDQNLMAIRNLLTNCAVPADNVVLEVTETSIVADGDGGVASLESLKRLGVRIAIDDFGTGFSSLSTLAKLPVDILKIDRSFVSGHAAGPTLAHMLEGILGLADRLSLAVIAEGIEEPDQLDLLVTLGCSMGQGYLLSRPMPAPALEVLLGSGALLHVPEPA